MGIELDVDESGKEYLIDKGYDEKYGARPLRRAIQRLIEDPLSEELLAGEWTDGDTVLCDVADGKFVFSHGTGDIPAPRPTGALGGSFEAPAPRSGNAAPRLAGAGSDVQVGAGAQ